MLCPVAVFAYKRPSHLERAIEGLKSNKESVNTDLYIFCDGAKKHEDIDDVLGVRKYANCVQGFRSITVVLREKNLGLSESIITGVTSICEKHGCVAVVEDDIIVSKYFLRWINSAIIEFWDEPKVVSVGCFVFPQSEKLQEFFFLSVPDCWGWAVWQRSWSNFNKDANDLIDKIENGGLAQKFDFGGAYAYTNMLKENALGNNDSWAVRWYASSFLSGGLTIYPNVSMTQNIGFDGSGTHCGDREIINPQLAMSEILAIKNKYKLVESVRARRVWEYSLSKINKRSIFQRAKSYFSRSIKVLRSSLDFAF